MALTLIVFVSVHLTGDPAIYLMPIDASSKEDYETIRKQLGLDRPLVVQYGIFLKDALKAILEHQ